MISQQPPMMMSANATPEKAGTAITAPGNAATAAAMASIASIPCFMISSGTASRPNGIATRASITIGMTMKDTAGIAARLPSTE